VPLPNARLLTRSRHGAAAHVAMLVVACLATAGASPRPAAADDVFARAYEGFQGTALHTWQPGQRRLSLRPGVDRDGELVTPRSRRSMAVVRLFGGAAGVQLRFAFQRRGRGAQTIATLIRNGVSLRVSRRGVLALCVSGKRRCAALGRTHRGRARWDHASVALDARAGAVLARLGRRRAVRLFFRAVPEQQVRVGDVRHEFGGPIAFDDLVLVTRTPAPPAPASPAPAAAPADVAPQRRFFAPDSVWNAPLPDNAPLDPQSTPITSAFRAEIARELAARTGPWIQTTDYSTPIYTVGPGQPRVRIALDVTASYGATLQRAFASVPLPADARPATGADGHLTVYQPSTDSLWEFWQLRRLTDGWHASWGGAMQRVSLSAGYFSAASWPGAGTHWGATATSLPLVAGTMLVSELLAGKVDHALALSVPNARAGVFAFPAQRTDGTSTDSVALPEGARLRLDPQLNIDALNLPPLVRTMAVAAQRYGMIVRDKTNAATGFFAEDPTPTGVNPYVQLFGGQWPVDLLAAFPWDHVQLLRMQLSSTG